MIRGMGASSHAPSRTLIWSVRIFGRLVRGRCVGRRLGTPLTPPTPPGLARLQPVRHREEEMALSALSKGRTARPGRVGRHCRSSRSGCRALNDNAAGCSWAGVMHTGRSGRRCRGIGWVRRNRVWACARLDETNPWWTDQRSVLVRSCLDVRVGWPGCRDLHGFSGRFCCWVAPHAMGCSARRRACSLDGEAWIAMGIARFPE